MDGCGLEQRADEMDPIKEACLRDGMALVKAARFRFGCKARAPSICNSNAALVALIG